LIEDSLSTGAVTIAIAGDALFDIIIVDLGVEEGLNAGFKTEFGVVDYEARFERSPNRVKIALPFPRGLMNLVRPTPNT
jgi:hypothetical protein